MNISVVTTRSVDVPMIRTQAGRLRVQCCVIPVGKQEHESLGARALRRAKCVLHTTSQDWVVAYATELFADAEGVALALSSDSRRHGRMVKIDTLDGLRSKTEVYTHTVAVLVSASGSARYFPAEVWGITSPPAPSKEAHFVLTVLEGESPCRKLALKRAFEALRLVGAIAEDA